MDEIEIIGLPNKEMAISLKNFLNLTENYMEIIKTLNKRIDDIIAIVETNQYSYGYQIKEEIKKLVGEEKYETK